MCTHHPDTESQVTDRYTVLPYPPLPGFTSLEGLRTCPFKQSLSFSRQRPLALEREDVLVILGSNAVLEDPDVCDGHLGGASPSPTEDPLAAQREAPIFVLVIAGNVKSPPSSVLLI